MEPKEWLKKELKPDTGGSLEAIFDTTISLLEARIKWLSKQLNTPGAITIQIARDDMQSWRDELKLTEEDDV